MFRAVSPNPHLPCDGPHFRHGDFQKAFPVSSRTLSMVWVVFHEHLQEKLLLCWRLRCHRGYWRSHQRLWRTLQGNEDSCAPNMCRGSGLLRCQDFQEGRYRQGSWLGSPCVGRGTGDASALEDSGGPIHWCSLGNKPEEWLRYTQSIIET